MTPYGPRLTSIYSQGAVQLALWADPAATTEVHLADYDVVLVSTSAGKDSTAMAAHLVAIARDAGVLNRVVAAHADLGPMEWPGTRELAARQIQALTLPAEPPIRFEVVRRDVAGEEDLIGYLLRWRRWPSAKARWCTAALKRGPLNRLITRLADELWTREPERATPVRVLNCQGMRAQESAARAKKLPLQVDDRSSSARKLVTRYLPLHAWTVDEVWATVRGAGLEEHPAYANGQSRASCVFCVLNSSIQELAAAARCNQALALLYELAEYLIGHQFRADLAMRDVLAAAGITPLPRDWPLEASWLAAPAGTATEAVLAAIRRDRHLPPATAIHSRIGRDVAVAADADGPPWRIR